MGIFENFVWPNMFNFYTKFITDFNYCKSLQPISEIVEENGLVHCEISAFVYWMSSMVDFSLRQVVM